MLNCLKKIKKKDVKRIIFWGIPFPPAAKFQMQDNPRTEFLEGLPVTFALPNRLKKKRWRWKPKHTRKGQKKLRPQFFFSAFTFNTIALFKKYRKLKRVRVLFNLKKKLLLIKKLFINKKFYKGYLLQPKKGGYFTTIFGFKGFMPKSHRIKLQKKRSNDHLIGLKFQTKRKRFSIKRGVKFNLISSSKIFLKRFQLKQGQKLYRCRPNVDSFSSILNKRIKNAFKIIKIL